MSIVNRTWWTERVICFCRLIQFTRRFQFSSTEENQCVNPLLLFSILMMCGGTRLLCYLLILMKELSPCSGLILLIKRYGHIPLILLNLWSPFDTCIYACVRTNIYSLATAIYVTVISIMWCKNEFSDIISKYFYFILNFFLKVKVFKVKIFLYFILKKYNYIYSTVYFLAS